MIAGLSAYLGVVGVVAVIAGLTLTKLPRFQTDAFKAQPEVDQARSMRRFRWLFGAVSVLAFVLLVGIGFLEGISRRRTAAGPRGS